MSETKQLGVGRELDAKIAQRLTDPENTVWRGKEDWVIVKKGMEIEQIPHYSTDIAAAWQLVEKYKLSLLQEQDSGDDIEWMCGSLNITGIGNRAGDDLSRVDVKFTSDWRLSTTAPHAICLCFLQLELE